jgi:transcriptional regulator GlxA family with amidase domain
MMRHCGHHPVVHVEETFAQQRGTLDTLLVPGITASLDLALALVAEDHGEEAALEVARIMVMYLQRPGGQSQFSVPGAQRASDRPDLRGLRLWIGENLAADLSVPALASRMAMSERHFARVFHAETGSTPGAFVELMRLEAARRLHRVFRARLRTTPGEYRRRFHTAAPA